MGQFCRNTFTTLLLVILCASSLIQWSEAEKCEPIEFYGGNLQYFGSIHRAEGTYAYYSCHDGYTISPPGIDYSECKRTSLRWEPEPPKCYGNCRFEEYQSIDTSLVQRKRARTDRDAIIHKEKIVYSCKNPRSYELCVRPNDHDLCTYYLENFETTCINGTFDQINRETLITCPERRCSITYQTNTCFWSNGENCKKENFKIQSQSSINVKCNDGKRYELYDNSRQTYPDVDSSTMKCDRGNLSTDLSCVPKRCDMSDIPTNRFTVRTPDKRHIMHNEQIVYRCKNDQYELFVKSTDSFPRSFTSTCRFGDFDVLRQNFPMCIERRCEITYQTSVFENACFWTDDDHERQCKPENFKIASGSSVIIGCKDGYELYDTIGEKCIDVERSEMKCIKGQYSKNLSCKQNDQIIDTFDDPFTGVVCGLRPMELIPRKKRGITKRELAFRVIGGSTSPKGLNPWQVGVRVPDVMNGGDKHWCGGTILSEYWILSAAHCFTNLTKDNVSVRVGDHDNKRQDDFEQEFKLEHLITHCKFEETTYDYDIALLKIKPKNGTGITFGYHVQPACLPDQTSSYADGHECHVSGWGTTKYPKISLPDMLQSATVNIINDETCQSLYMFNGTTRITSRMVCAGNLEGGIDTCKGDSGGPLVCDINSLYTLTGVTSWGEGCGLANKPGVYARVTEFVPWIKEKLKKYSDGCRLLIMDGSRYYINENNTNIELLEVSLIPHDTIVSTECIIGYDMMKPDGSPAELNPQVTCSHGSWRNIHLCKKQGCPRPGNVPIKHPKDIYNIGERLDSADFECPPSLVLMPTNGVSCSTKGWTETVECKPKIKYVIQIKTGSHRFAGTYARVYVNLHGEEYSTQKLYVRGRYSADALNEDNMWEVDITPIRYITVGRDSVLIPDDLQVDFVSIFVDSDNGKTTIDDQFYNFDANPDLWINEKDDLPIGLSNHPDKCVHKFKPRTDVFPFRTDMTLGFVIGREAWMSERACKQQCILYKTKTCVGVYYELRNKHCYGFEKAETAYFRKLRSETYFERYCS